MYLSLILYTETSNPKATQTFGGGVMSIVKNILFLNIGTVN